MQKSELFLLVFIYFLVYYQLMWSFDVVLQSPIDAMGCLGLLNAALLKI